MRYISLLASVAVMLIIIAVGCKKDRDQKTLSIAYTGDAIAGNTLVFSTDKNTGNLLWDFGDGNSATGASVTHTYSKKGNYNIIVSGDEGGVDYKGNSGLYITDTATIYTRKYYAAMSKVRTWRHVYHTITDDNGTLHDSTSNHTDTTFAYKGVSDSVILDKSQITISPIATAGEIITYHSSEYVGYTKSITIGYNTARDSMWRLQTTRPKSCCTYWVTEYHSK